MTPDQHRDLEEWGEAECGACGNDQAAHIEPRRQGVCETFTHAHDVVLVHGAVHGAWCWDHLVPLLERDDRVGRVVAVDLPGHGANRSIPEDDITLEDYVATVVDAVHAADLRRVVLVGHSLGGITITPASHALGDRLSRIVYLTTICPPVGRSVNDHLIEPEDGLEFGVDVPAMFCTDFTDEQTAWLTERLGGEPLGPFTTPASIERPPDGLDSRYIRCERDEALPADLQTACAARVGATVHSLDAGHSPFVTHVDLLTELILEEL
ncbi:MAG: alpha/beta hydrolase [Actinomycetota bacterium]